MCDYAKPYAEHTFSKPFVNTLSDEVDKLTNSIIRVRELHTPTEDGKSCVECSRIICLGTPNGLGSMQYPCLTIMALGGKL